MLTKPIKTLICCITIACVAFTACKKGSDATIAFSEGSYTGRVIYMPVQGSNIIVAPLPANITFAAGKYTANNVPLDQLPYTDFIPYIGTYELQTEGTILVMMSSQPLPVISPFSGQFNISYKADSLILTENLAYGSGYQYRLKKIR